MATVKEFRMSQERYDELKHELEYSKTTRADEIAELIKEARGFGDLSENSEYDEAKNEQGKLYSRIAELEEILLHAVIVDESDVDSDRISIGCRVTVTNLDNGKQLPEYTIVGSQEANVMERTLRRRAAGVPDRDPEGRPHPEPHQPHRAAGGRGPARQVRCLLRRSPYHP